MPVFYRRIAISAAFQRGTSIQNGAKEVGVIASVLQNVFSHRTSRNFVLYTDLR